jgi:hypothetical protein
VDKRAKGRGREGPRLESKSGCQETKGQRESSKRKSVCKMREHARKSKGESNVAERGRHGCRKPLTTKEIAEKARKQERGKRCRPCRTEQARQKKKNKRGQRPPAAGKSSLMCRNGLPFPYRSGHAPIKIPLTFSFLLAAPHARTAPQTALPPRRYKDNPSNVNTRPHPHTQSHTHPLFPNQSPPLPSLSLDLPLTRPPRSSRAAGRGGTPPP